MSSCATSARTARGSTSGRGSTNRGAARFTDLDHLPPPNHPEEPIYRQRQPEREDVPKQQRGPDAPITGPSLPRTLAAWTAEEVGYHCRRCGRREVFSKAAMLATYGDLALDPLLELMAKGCPKWGNTQIYELCGAMFIAPWERSGTPGE